MKGNALTDEMRRFILTSIPSVPYLEAVLLLRSAPGTAWDVPTLARRLYLGEPQAAELLAQLSAAGVAQPEEGGSPPLYRYRPADQALALRLDDLAKAYAADLVGVADLIHSRIDKRAQRFADAFRLRKDS